MRGERPRGYVTGQRVKTDSPRARGETAESVGYTAFAFMAPTHIGRDRIFAPVFVGGRDE